MKQGAQTKVVNIEQGRYLRKADGIDMLNKIELLKTIDLMPNIFFVVCLGATTWIGLSTMQMNYPSAFLMCVGITFCLYHWPISMLRRKLHKKYLSAAIRMGHTNPDCYDMLRNLAKTPDNNNALAKKARQVLRKIEHKPQSA